MKKKLLSCIVSCFIVAIFFVGSFVPVPYVLATTIGSDTFTRTVTGGWGTATTGGNYSVSGGSTSDYNVTGSEGTMNITAAGNSKMAALTSLSQQDYDVTVKLKTSNTPTTATSTNGYNIGIITRRINGSNYYFSKVRFQTNGTVTVKGGKYVSGSEENLTSFPAAGIEPTIVGLTHSANTYYWLRTQVVGTNPTTVNIKVWADGQSEPSSFQYSGGTDSEAALQTTGAAGIRLYASSGNTNLPVLFTIDDLSVNTYVAPTSTPIPTATPTPTPGGTIYTVTPSGSTIQTVLNAAAAGDTILLGDGVYHQQVTVSKAITLKAENPGQATLTGKYNGALTFSPVPGDTDNVYTLDTPVPNWTIRWIMRGSDSLLEFDSLAHLKTYSLLNDNPNPDVYVTVPSDGFYYDSVNDQLYVRLRDGSDPNDADLEINRSMSSNAGTGITISDGVDDVTIEGITFRGWHTNGINLAGTSHNVTVNHNLFEGVFRGVNALSGTPEDLAVDYNEFSGLPVFDLRQEGDQGGADETNTWAALYDSNLSVRFVRANMNKIYIRHNYLHDVFDGLEIKGWASEATTSTQSDISYNFIQNIVDNPFEFDVATKYLNMRAHHNVVLDGYTLLSTAPFQSGIMQVDHNIFYTSPEEGLDQTTWLKNCSHSGVNIGLGQTGMEFTHNTVVLGNSSTQDADVWTSCDSASFTYTSSFIENNIVVTKNSRVWNLSGFDFRASNVMYGSYTSSKKVNTSIIFADPLFATPVNGKFSFNLQSSSPAILSGDDIGAINYGESWSFSQPGPSWATGADTPSSRPVIPASFDSTTWVGLSAIASTPTPTPTPTTTPTPTPTPIPNPPAVGLTPISPDPTATSTPTISGTASDSTSTIASVAYQVDSTSGTWNACSPIDGTFDEASDSFVCISSALSEGAHTIYVRATTQDSRISINVSDGFEVDTTAPEVSVTEVSGNTTTDTTPTVTGSAIDTSSPVTSVEYQMDSTSGAWSDCLASDGTFNESSEAFSCTVSPALSEASHTIYIRSTDSLSNTTASSFASDTFTVASPDSTAPDITLDEVTNPTNSNTPTVRGSTTDSSSTVSAIEYQMDGTGGSWTACSADDGAFNEDTEDFTCSVTDALSDGVHVMYVRGTDSMNNTTASSSEDYVTIIINDDGPVISQVSVTPTTTGATISWLTNELSSSSIEYDIDTGFGTSTVETDTSPRVNSHEASLIGLLSCSTYNYRVRSSDPSFHDGYSNAGTFTTTGCTGNSSISSQTNEVIDSLGGDLSLYDGSGRGIILTIPTDFSSFNADFQIKQLESSSVYAAVGYPSGLIKVSTLTYELKALTDTTTLLSSFDEPLTVTMQYIASDMDTVKESTLRIFRWDGASWNGLTNCSTDTTLRTVTCPTTNFSVFGLFGEEKPQSSSSSQSESRTASSGPATCSASKPGSAPDLFQIDRVGSKVTLHFAPSRNPYDAYQVIYGLKPEEERYATSFPLRNSPGVIRFTVNELHPKTTYYFKVRAVNDCTGGDWSRTMTAKAVYSNAKITFYPTSSNFVTSLLQKAQAVKRNLQYGTKEVIISPSQTPLQPPSQLQTQPKPTSVELPPETKNVAPLPKASASQPKKTSHWYDFLLNLF